MGLTTSLFYGVYMSGKDQSPIILDTIEETMDCVFMEGKVMSDTLKMLSNGLNTNTSLKRRVASNKQWLLRLLELSKRKDDGKDGKNVRKDAIKALQYITEEEEAREIFINSGVLPDVINRLSLEESLLVKKTLGIIVANCILGSENGCEELKRVDNIVEQLFIVSTNKYTSRKRLKRGLSKLCYYIMLSNNNNNDGDGIIHLNEREKLIVEREYEAYGKEMTSPLFEWRETMTAFGVNMYAHTMAGGFAWGTMVSLMRKAPMNELLHAAFRTATVTAIVPLALVGVGVSLYQHVRRKMDDQFSLIVFHTISCTTLLPLYYVLPIVEKFAPLWLGGHVLGFLSFFIYLRATSSDIFISDQILENYDKTNNKTSYLS